ncbi:hypothetical protein F4779DRAFT_188290 [Xylariaceae sp. FL0662B]|nr:hypothetical protein F4779DRAFT_188290 [Xylariaceae sp. FL0662B]
MADNAADGIEKAPDAPVEATSQPSEPPVAKAPVKDAEDSVAPSITAETATAATAPSADPKPAPAPAAQNDTAGGENQTEKPDEADKLASQTEKPASPARTPVSQPATTDVTQTGAPSVQNGDNKGSPKPVTVEEVRDQDRPTPPSLEMTGALQPDKPVTGSPKGSPKVEATPATSEAVKPEATTAAKRKASDAEAINGDASLKESAEEVQPEKKQKTNGATANGGPKKAGRPRKNKSAPPPVGKTARKTRSQGAAE